MNDNVVEKFSNNKYKEIALVISAIITFFVLNFEQKYSLKVNNIYLYFVSIVVFFISFVFCNTIFCFINRKTSDRGCWLSSKWVEIATGLLLLLLTATWYFKAFYKETTDSSGELIKFYRHNIGDLIYFLIIIATTIFVTYRINKCMSSNVRIRLISIIAFTIIQGWFLFVPNYERDTNGGMYHLDAYVNSIYNAIKGVPFSEATRGIYGHYGMFFVLPVRVLNTLGVNTWIAITICIAVLGMIAFFAQGILLSKLIKNDVIFIFSILALAMPSFQLFTGVYYQVIPHRILFPNLVLLTLYYYIKKPQKKQLFWLLWGVVTLAMLWNFETGVICLVISVLAYIYIQIRKNDLHLIKNILFGMLVAGCCFFTSYLLFNIFNIRLGGSWLNIREYIYPIGVKNAAIEDLQLELQNPFSWYFIIIIILMMVICYWLLDIIRKKIDDDSLIVVLASIMGVGLFTYYMNRAYYTNTVIVAFEFILALAFVLEKLSENLKEKYNSTDRKGIVGLLDMESATLISAVILLVCMTLSSVVSVAPNLESLNRNAHDTEQIVMSTSYLDSILPSETPAYGYGTCLLYSYLNRDTHIYMEDWEDLFYFGEKNPKGFQYLVNELAENNYPYLLVGEYENVYVPAEYVKIFNYQTADIFGIKFNLYSRLNVPGDYYFLMRSYMTAGIVDSIDNTVILAQKIEENDAEAVDEIWNKMIQSGVVSDDMSAEAYICYLYENVLGRKATEEELTTAMNIVENQSMKDLYVLMANNCSYQDESKVLLNL